jgi:hypothetical protein
MLTICGPAVENQERDLDQTENKKQASYPIYAFIRSSVRRTLYNVSASPPSICKCPAKNININIGSTYKSLLEG